MSEEIERIQGRENAPFIGVLSFGEFENKKGDKHEFCNNTCCVVAMKEK